MLYRNTELRHHQYFAYTEWPGGVYASPGVAGSRSGGLIAATWAAMVGLGENGYLELAEPICDTADELRELIDSHPELRRFGHSPFMVAFGSDELDIWHLNDALQERGWRMNGCQHPAGIHFCVTRPNTQPGVVDAFADALREAIDYAKDPPDTPPKSGALYGGGRGRRAGPRRPARRLPRRDDLAASGGVSAEQGGGNDHVLAVDMGTGTAKVALVSVDGRIAASAAAPDRPDPRPGRRRRAGPRAVVERGQRGGARGDRGGRDPARARDRDPLHDAVGGDGPRGRGREGDRQRDLLARRPRRSPREEGRRGSRQLRRLLAAQARPLDPDDRRGAGPRGVRRARPHAPPQARPARGLRRRREAARALRLPQSPLHRPGGRLLRLDLSGLAHRQPRRERGRLRPGPAPLDRDRPRQAPRPAADGRGRGAAAAGGRLGAGPEAGNPGPDRAHRPPGRRRSGPARSGRRTATSRSGPRPGSRATSRRRRPTSATRWGRCPPRCRAAGWRSPSRAPPAAASSSSRTTSSTARSPATRRRPTTPSSCSSAGRPRSPPAATG